MPAWDHGVRRQAVAAKDACRGPCHRHAPVVFNDSGLLLRDPRALKVAENPPVGVDRAGRVQARAWCQGPNFVAGRLRLRTRADAPAHGPVHVGKPQQSVGVVALYVYVSGVAHILGAAIQPIEATVTHDTVSGFSHKVFYPHDVEGRSHVCGHVRGF